MNKFIIIIMALVLSLNISAQKLTSEIPFNKNVRRGVLSNGLTYYICHNENPQGKASYYLVQNVGALMEEEHEKGLAHFLEHMCFNGSKHFPGRSMVKFLEGHGAKTGVNINAMTAKNETVYNLLDITTQSEGIIDTCLLILRDWADELTLSEKDIDEERGVIVEEWRSSQNATSRILAQITPALVNYSRYAERDVIGDMEIVKNFDPDVLRNFYKKWYRTDLQCIIVSGDVDVDEVEEKIKKEFSTIPVVQDKEERIQYFIPDNEKPIVCIARDKEIEQSTIELYVRHKNTQEGVYTYKDIRDTYVASLFNTLAQNRVNKYLFTAEVPFSYAKISHIPFIKNYQSYVISVKPKKGKELESFRKIMEINQNIINDGFTTQEFLNAKASYIAASQNFYNNAVRTNTSLASHCQNNYLLGSPIVDYKESEKFFKNQINTITNKELQKKAKEWFSEGNRVIVAYGKEGNEIITESQVLDIIAQAKNNDKISGLKEKEYIEKPLLAEPVKGQSYVKVEKLDKFRAEKWTLDNGAVVYYKYCNTRPGAIKLKAYSFGGLSLIEKDDLPSAQNINDFMPAFGLGDHDAQELAHMLKGSNVKVTAKVDDLAEYVVGHCQKANFEKMMQMFYMKFEKPRFDQNMFDIIKGKIRENYHVSKNSESKVLGDSLSLIFSDYNARIHIVNDEYIHKMQLPTIERIYRERFSNAKDFTFYLAGDVNKKKAKDLVAKYIGAIPSTDHVEQFKHWPNTFPKGKTTKVLEFDSEANKASVILTYNLLTPFTYEKSYGLSLMTAALNYILNEKIREEAGGTYNVSANCVPTRYPEGSFMLTAQFVCDPARVPELKRLLYSVIDDVRNNGIPKELFNKIYNSAYQKMGEKMVSNSYWINVFSNLVIKNEDHTTDKYDKDIMKNMNLEDVNALTKQYFSEADLIDIVTRPKK